MVIVPTYFEASKFRGVLFLYSSVSQAGVNLETGHQVSISVVSRCAMNLWDFAWDQPSLLGDEVPLHYYSLTPFNSWHRQSIAASRSAGPRPRTFPCSSDHQAKTKSGTMGDGEVDSLR